MNNIIKKTPLEFNYRLSKLYNCNVFLKREDLQIVRSFKIRGAYNKIKKLNNVKNVVCASAGNHAQGVAYVCNKLNINSNIFIPNNTPLQKIKKIKQFGNGNCNIHLYGNTFDECLLEAKNFTNILNNKAKNNLNNNFNNNNIFIHPFDDLDVIEGQGTILDEIYDKVNPDIITTCVGGGGLISGLQLNSQINNRKVLLYGAEAEKCASMKQSLEKNKIVKLENIDTFVDGASVAEIGKNNFEICKNNIENIYEIENGLVCQEIVNFYENEGIILEPAGVLSVASLKYIPDICGKTVVCIISGGNNDLTRYPEIMEKYLVYKNLRHYFIIDFYQKPGELKLFVENILDKEDDIIRFEYIKKGNKEKDVALVGIEVNKSNDIKKIIKNLNNNNFNFKKIEKNDILYELLI